MSAPSPGAGRGVDRRAFLQDGGRRHRRPGRPRGPRRCSRQDRRRPIYPEDLNAYLRIGEDGRVTIFSGKIEMGQGVMTSQAQMAAEELGVALDAIEMVLGDTDRCPWDMGTFGSLTTRMFGPGPARRRRRGARGAGAARREAARGGQGPPGGGRRRGLRGRRAGAEGQLRRARPRQGDLAPGRRGGGAALGEGVRRDGPLARRASTGAPR